MQRRTASFDEFELFTKHVRSKPKYLSYLKYFKWASKFKVGAQYFIPNQTKPNFIQV